MNSRFADTPLEMYHFRQGFLRFFIGSFGTEEAFASTSSISLAFKRTLTFWQEADETRDLFSQSLYKNIIGYILPVILYRRFIDTLKHNYLPEETGGWGNVLTGVDLISMGVIFSRLSVRRLVDNTMFSAMLPRVIYNDVATYTLKNISTKLSFTLVDLFQNFWACTRTEIDEDFRKIFEEKLLSHFKRLFAASAFSAKKKFVTLKKALRDEFKDILDKKYNDNNKERISNISQFSAQMIAYEFARVDSFLDEKIFNEGREKLIQELKLLYETESAKQYAKKFCDQVNTISNQARFSFLPYTYVNCQCSQEKKIHASISSQFYYIGNLLFALSFIARLEGYSFLLPLSYLIFSMQLINYGQNLNEYKVAQACTSHRYEFFNRNIAYNFGIGLAYYLTTFIIAKSFPFLANLNTLFWENSSTQNSSDSLLMYPTMYFLNDAAAALAVQFGLVAILSSNERLPDKGNKPRDIFWLSRNLIRTARYFLYLCFLKPLFPEDAQNQFENIWNQFERIKKVLPIFAWTVDLLLNDSEFLPRKELIFPREDGKFLLPWNKKTIRNPEEVFLELSTVKQFLILYRKEINDAIITAKDWDSFITKINYWDLLFGQWASGALLFFSPAFLPSSAVSTGTVLLNILKNPEVKSFIKRVFLKIQNYGRSNNEEVCETYIYTTSLARHIHPQFFTSGEDENEEREALTLLDLSQQNEVPAITAMSLLNTDPNTPLPLSENSPKGQSEQNILSRSPVTITRTSNPSAEDSKDEVIEQNTLANFPESQKFSGLLEIDDDYASIVQGKEETRTENISISQNSFSIDNEYFKQASANSNPDHPVLRSRKISVANSIGMFLQSARTPKQVENKISKALGSRLR